MANKHKRPHRNVTIPVPHNPPGPANLEKRTEFVQITYEAPLPPPAMLEQYERILPGISHRLVTRMEEQTTHRHQIENKAIDANISNERRGQIIAGILGLIAILAGFYLIAADKDAYGIAIFITTFASFIAIFLVGKYQQSKQLAIRRKEMKELLPKPPQEPHE